MLGLPGERARVGGGRDRRVDGRQIHLRVERCRATLAAGLQQRARQQDHGGGAAVRGGPERDADTVTAGEAADHEETEPVAVEQVRLLRVGDAAVGLGDGLLAHAEPAVLDLHRVARADLFAGDQHLGVRRRERRGVLDEFGEQVGEVGDGRAHHGDAGEAPDVDAGVVLDLGDRRADHVQQRHRLAPGTAGRGTGEDDQALGVAAHPGGEVVEPEQVLQLGRVLGAALHRVQQRQLPVHQHLAAPGQVDEDAGDAGEHLGALDGGGERRTLHGVEGLAHLAELVVPGLDDGRLGLDVDLLPRPQPPHRGGQPPTGQLQRGVAQFHQLDDEPAADPHGDQQRQDDGGEAEEDGGAARAQHPEAVRVGIGPRLGTGGRQHGIQPMLHGGRRRRPVGAGGAHGSDAAAGGVDRVLQPEQGLGLLVVRHLPVGGEVRGLQVRCGGGDEGEAGVTCAGELLVLLRGHPPRGLSGLHGGVLAGQHLASLGEFQQHPRVGGGGAVLHGRQRTDDAEAAVHDARVGGRRAGPVHLPSLDAGAEPAQRGGGGVQRLDAAGQRGRQTGGVGFAALDVLAQGGHGGVGGLGPAVVVGHPDLAGRGQVGEGRGAFGLDRREGGVQGLQQRLVDVLQAHQGVDLLGGGDGGEAPQGEQRDNRDHQQRDDAGAHGARAQPQAQRQRVGAVGDRPSLVGGRPGVGRTRTRRDPGSGGAGGGGGGRGSRGRGGGRHRGTAGAWRRPSALTLAARCCAVGESATNAEVRKR